MWQVQAGTVLDCGGKRSATPLLPARTVVAIPKTLARSKALSPLRSASAVHDAQFPSPLIFHFVGQPDKHA
jgi:hypothetical protein